MIDISANLFYQEWIIDVISQRIFKVFLKSCDFKNVFASNTSSLLYISEWPISWNKYLAVVKCRILMFVFH